MDVPLSCGFMIPLRRFLKVLGDSLPPMVHGTKVELRIGIALV
eukprot:CAMPEP_0171844416 /NCGR_PEP_ID=MMETSP0992-20121227/16482_1 /TAXON_ID=483369 /ORGANISM="non described non described, Strain CCMP2098" /LENGTH=42 /DNA_ID= /DNA_START= /DNA_END= /DNA_ORIENTATION=